MQTIDLFDDSVDLKIPNVSQVPQYSPLRYPGGKTRWYPFFKRWLIQNQHVDTLVEPFAGGASMGLAAAIDNLVDRVVLAELNPRIAAFWYTVFHGHAEWLIDRILNFEVTRENVLSLMEQDDLTVREQGFLFFLHNRTSRGGITASGAGLLKNGENGRGIASRWYPDTFAERIRRISEHSHKIDFVWGDGITVMKASRDEANTAFFVDPPYTVAGRRLYDKSEIDHDALFDLLSTVEGSFLATYDNSELIRELARSRGFDMDRILMSTTHHEKKFELLISRSMPSW